MKKFKSILCGALAFVAGSVALSACGVKTEPQTDPTEQTAVVGTKTTISLAEAERIIVNALAIDNNQLQTQSTRGMVLHAADASEGNRDIMKKLGKFTLTQNFTVVDMNGNETQKNHMNGIINYNQDCQFESGLMNETNTFSNGSYTIKNIYLSGSHCYKQEGSSKNEPSVDIVKDFDAQSYSAALLAVFSDEAFDKVYDKYATKEITENGYSLTLHGEMRQYYYLLAVMWGQDVSNFDEDWKSQEAELKEYYTDEQINACHIDLIIYLNNKDEIVSADIDYVDLGNLCVTNCLLTITKTNEPITEPNWVTEYRRTNGIA